MRILENIKLKVLILPIIDIIMFITISSFGQHLLMNIGLSFIMALVWLLIYVINFKNIPTKINICFIGILIYTAVINIFSGDWYYWTITVGTIAATSVLIKFDMNNDEWKNSFIITSLFSFVVLTLYELKLFLANWNSNSIALFCLFGMMLILIALRLESKKKNRILIYVYIIAELLMLYATESRTAILMFLIAFLTVNVFKKIISTKAIFIIYLLICLFASMLAIQYNNIIKLDIMKPILEFSKEYFGKATLFSDREIIWENCERLIGDNWIFGTGKSLYNILYSHNMFYSVEYTYGVVGFLLYINLIYNIIMYVKNKSNGNIISNSLCLLVVATMVGQVTENILFTSNTNSFLPYMFLSIAIGIASRNGSEK